MIAGFRDGHVAPLPDYFNDLNTMQDAWSLLGWEEKNDCIDHLQTLVQEADCEVYFATAAQRAEAFGLALGLWKEGE